MPYNSPSVSEGNHADARASERLSLFAGGPTSLLGHGKHDNRVFRERCLAGLADYSVLDFQLFRRTRHRVAAEAGTVAGRRQGNQRQVAGVLLQRLSHVLLFGAGSVFGLDDFDLDWIQADL